MDLKLFLTKLRAMTIFFTTNKQKINLDHVRGQSAFILQYKVKNILPPTEGSVFFFFFLQLSQSVDHHLLKSFGLVILVHVFASNQVFVLFLKLIKTIKYLLSFYNFSKQPDICCAYKKI